MSRRKNVYCRLVFGLLAASLFGGCVVTGDMDSRWIGRPVSELLAARGEPDSTVTLKDGRQIMMWTSFESPRQVVPCRRTFTIGANGMVEKVSSSDCPPNQLTPLPRARPNGNEELLYEQR
jgi:hypothetical protein